MKMKSKLWMLAVAMATVGCQDELGNDPNVTGGEDFNGPSAYMNISVNAGLQTRANPTGGEAGDGDEPGSLEESNVKDVTVVLFKGVSGASGGTTGNYDINVGNNEIAGVGYVSNNNGMVTDGTDKHLWASTVQIKIVDTDKWDGQTFGVLAITNLGSGTDGVGNDIYKGVLDGEITTVQELANEILPEYRTSQGFVMSTHTMQWGNMQSLVTLNASSTPDNAPSVEVFVERLAAKVRINAAPSSEYYLGNYVYAIENDRIVLQNGAVVNQLTSGSYLLKRTTELPVGGGDATISDPTALLGDELAAANGSGLNFIIDPWTTQKEAPYKDYTTLSPVNGVSLTYDNPLQVEDYATWWGMHIATADNTAEYSRFALYNNPEAQQEMTLCYTMENTTSVAAQKNGYSTGILFQAQYFPEKWTAVSSDDTTGPAAIDYDSNTEGDQSYDDVIKAGGTPEAKTFIVEKLQKSNPNTHTPIAYENYEAVLAGYLNDLLGEVLEDDDLTISDFNDENITKLKVSTFNNSKAVVVVDPFGYIAYLKDRAAEILASAAEGDENNVTFAASDSFQAFQKTGKFDNSDFLVYTGGVCYYPFWIRHANNGDDNEMGISEFAIVRNNIYDVTVTQIQKLGLAGSEIPDPDKDDENEELFLVVNLHVKDWVLRTNSTILY